VNNWLLEKNSLRIKPTFAMNALDGRWTFYANT